MRPFLRWLLFAICLAVFTGAMLWISTRMLDLEEQRHRTLKDAQVQEKLRLALWRMDSLTSALLIRENARPPHHYQAFYAPDDLLASANQSLPQGTAWMPSPLFGHLPDLVQVHFEQVLGETTLTSPQAPVGKQRELAMSWYSPSPEVAQANQKLVTLQALLQRHPEIHAEPSAGDKVMNERKPQTAPADRLKSAINGLPGEQQALANVAEQSQRALILDNTLTQEKKESVKPLLKKLAPAPAPQPAASALSDVSNRYSSRSGAAERAETESVTASPALRQPLPALAGDLRPQWLGRDLFLLRHASLEGRQRLQGVWLDWPQLQSRLLDSVRDLLPQSELLPVSPESARSDALAMVTLPIKLLPGRVTVNLPDPGSALRPVLALAWACLMAAAIAIAFVLHRAVRLSERRGAFVSAVTHELRTPLTTFRLYSEMLADDMVPEPERRREYLQTLCDESTRLMHLVENVLTFSRIEKGRTAARTESLEVAALVRQMEPRLRQRTDSVGLLLKTQLDPAAAAAHVQVDALAVEQILFNLTDNACKYAAPDSVPREVHFSAALDQGSVVLTLRDFGPGLSREAKRRLFQPFAKSATEAAHSAPGVGLGLALCRRLARELGGHLRHVSSHERGAIFRLTLPRDGAV